MLCAPIASMSHYFPLPWYKRDYILQKTFCTLYTQVLRNIL